MLEQEVITADPAIVTALADSIMFSLEKVSKVEDITTSDVLSALFTVLDNVLRRVGKDLPEDEKAYNSREVGRILTDLLMEYGAEALPRN